MVKEKEEAKEQYEDAIAAGNAAVIAERDMTAREVMQIKLGNLKPLQQMTLKLTLLRHLEVK